MKKSVIYIGIRESASGKFKPCFLNDKEFMFFQKVKYCRIGHEYELLKDRKMYTIPEDLGMTKKATEDQIEKWKLEDEIAIEEKKRRAANTRAKAFSLKYKTLAEIKVISKKLTFRERKALFQRLESIIVFGEEL